MIAIHVLSLTNNFKYNKLLQLSHDKCVRNRFLFQHLEHLKESHLENFRLLKTLG